MLIREIRGCFLCLLVGVLSAGLAAAAPAKDGDLRIVRVFTDWRDASSFKRISEYFDGKENTGGELMLRTHPEERAGLYFFLRVANRGAAGSARLQLQLIAPTSAKPVAYTFPVALNSGDTVINLGLTGPDWPDKKADPVAWKITLLGADGQSLVSDASYLWEKPAGN
ncbi:MAG: hypothetical protein HY302_08785 [Opitutae bacterium]|nr:hypothetical protein [Opitutae bacterium]